MDVRTRSVTFFPVDALTVGFAGALSLLVVAARMRLPQWHALFLVNVVLVAWLSIVAWLADRGSLARVLHDWALAPALYVFYTELHFIDIPLHRGATLDAALIRIDRWLFGAVPAAWLAVWVQPWLTDLLQLAYTLFYAFIAMVGFELYRGRDRRRFRMYAFWVALGFFATFAGYLLVPAVGPRFTVYSFSALDHDLPGLLIARPLRSFVNAAGFVPTGVPDAVAAAYATRDVFPSGHVLVTVLLVVFSRRARLRLRWPVTAWAVLLVVSTVYLRYHYAIDVVAGFALAFVCMRIATPLHRRLGSWLEHS